MLGDKKTVRENVKRGGEKGKKKCVTEKRVEKNEAILVKADH